MILQQYRELLKLRGVEMKKGKTLNDIVTESGGMPHGNEYTTITERAMFKFISDIEECELEIKELKQEISRLNQNPTDMELDSYIRFQATQIARKELSDCDGSYVGTEHITSFIYGGCEYDMTLNIFWEKQNHINISVISQSNSSYQFDEMIYF